MYFSGLAGSSPKMAPVKYTPTLPPPVFDNNSPGAAAYARANAPVEEEIPEVVVTAKRTPWYVWAGIGAVSFLILDGLARR